MAAEPTESVVEAQTVPPAGNEPTPQENSYDGRRNGVTNTKLHSRLPVLRSNPVGVPSGASRLRGLKDRGAASQKELAQTSSDAGATFSAVPTAGDRRAAVREAAGRNVSQSGGRWAAARQLPKGSVAVFSLGGGSGKTTICATIAQQLRESGERVMLADFSADSLLPMYFGGRSFRSGSLETFLDDDEGGLPLHLYREDETDGAGTDGAGTDGASMIQRLQLQVSSLGDNFDHVIIDTPAGAHKSRWPLFQAARTCLVVIVPDLHSAIGVEKLEQFCHQQQAGAGDEVVLYYVLNKFNPARALHLEIRQQLHQQLGERLLPISIQRSDEIAEALAAGKTVVDYARGAPVVQDFVRLSQWIDSIA
jgi:cellulose synthase operon protein YhjQ